ncbi:hypothetical protein [Streptomyces kanasensis]|uniref:hypothetical protein n=1 Tax=Streptomyces kanasensis TaxID=936756 RepID=UPI0038113677
MAVVLALLLGLVACDEAGPRQEESAVSADEVCEGVFSGPAARVLERSTGAEEFRRHRAAAGVRGTAEAIESLHDAHLVDEWLKADLCRVYTPRSDTAAVEITFDLVREKALATSNPSLVPYGLGRKAHADAKVAFLYVQCAGPRLADSANRPAVIRGELSRYLEPPLPEEEARQANLRLLAAATRALAKSLQCENDAGLSADPLPKPLP